jgi:acetylornithine deacetylase/succinyl-diaminopimelate desuccinylase-like protein
MRPFLLFLALAGFAALAAAQLRTIPAEAQRASMRHLEGMRVALDGKPAQLTPGAQIRNTENRIVVPSSVSGTVTVRYLLDPSGQQVHRVWILSAEEAAASAPKPKPAPPPAPKADENKADEKKAGSS